jgi:hypothetical protein
VVVEDRPVEREHVKPRVDIGMLDVGRVQKFHKHFQRNFVFVKVEVWDSLGDREFEDIPVFVGSDFGVRPVKSIFDNRTPILGSVGLNIFGENYLRESGSSFFPTSGSRWPIMAFHFVTGSSFSCESKKTITSPEEL